jgi:hypothetical protein
VGFVTGVAEGTRESVEEGVVVEGMEDGTSLSNPAIISRIWLFKVEYEGYLFHFCNRHLDGFLGNEFSKSKKWRGKVPR